MHQDIGGAQEFVQPGFAGIRIDIQFNTQFSPIPALAGQFARVIMPAGRLDFDHFSAMIGEQDACDQSGADTGNIKDSKMLQWAWHDWILFGHVKTQTGYLRSACARWCHRPK